MHISKSDGRGRSILSAASINMGLSRVEEKIARKKKRRRRSEAATDKDATTIFIG